MLKGQMPQPQKILILAAIPHGLRLDKEIRSVEECIRRAVRRDMFEVDIRTAIRPQDIRRAIAEEKPTIVHFCGHGLSDGSLLLEDNGGENKAVSPEGLASLFELHADYVNCVLLNACHSVKSAEAISKYIKYAIGMNQEIQDKSAIGFAQGFYDGLGYETSDEQDEFQRAFKEGLVAIKLENLSQAEIPVIKTRINNIDKPHKPMDIALLVKFLAPCLPFLLNVGNKAVEGASQKLGEDVWLHATAIWGKLQPKVEAKPIALGAASELANSPNDADALDILQKQLKKLLDEDKALAAEIAGLMSEDSEVISKVVNTFNQSITGNNNVVQNVTGDGNKSIGKVGEDATIN
jgi:CHAT domain